MSQNIAFDAFKKTLGTVAANKAMEIPIALAGEAIGSYFGQKSHGPTGPSPQDIYGRDPETGKSTDKVVGQEATGFGGAVRDYAYSLMTERGWDPRMSKQSAIDNDPLNPTDMYNAGRRRPVEPYKGTNEKGQDRWYSSYTKNSENPFLQGVYNNAESLASTAGIAAPIAGAAAVGLGIHFATKPRSDYALAVGGGLGPSTGNSNIDAARASAHYQQETAQMKFEHQMALQQMRQQAQTPGRQSGGGGMGGGPRDAYSMATSIIGAQTPVYG
jgi:hypothetical protein